MKKYEITIEEVISQTFEVEAEDIEKAMEIANEKYNRGKFVLEPGEVVSKSMMGYDSENESETNWVEF